MAEQVREQLAVRAVPNRTARRVAAVLAFAALTALGARLSVPLPGMVPVTMQTLFVTLAGAMLGPYLGAASQVVYLLAGISGLPVFAMGSGLGYLFGPTGGYLLSYPLAAALTGVLAGRTADPNFMRGFVRIALAMLIASVLTLALGWAQLALLTGNPERALRAGVLPFIVGDLLKVALGALIAQRARRQTLGLR